MQRMRNFEILYRLLQGLDDPARRYAVKWHDIVEAKGPRIVFECRRAARIDAFDAEAIARRHG